MAPLPTLMTSAAAWTILPLPEGAVEVHLVRRVRKSIGIRIADGRVELIAHPRISQARLREVLLARQDWIARHVVSQREQKQQLADLTVLSYLGRELPIQLAGGLRRTARLEGDVLQVCGIAAGDTAGLQAVVTAWLKRQAQLCFAQRLGRFAAHCPRQPGKLALSSARTRWGSCTARGDIRLNWRLMQAPLPIIDYVLAHELAHLLHMNHSSAFWAETARLFPDWKNARHWLKQQGSSLFRFG